MSFTSGYPKKKAKPGPPSLLSVFSRTLNNGLFVAMGSSGNLKNWLYRVKDARQRYEASLPQEDVIAQKLMDDIRATASQATYALDNLERVIRLYNVYAKQKGNHDNPG